MAASPENTGRFRFGPFLVDPSSAELWRGNARLRVQDLPFRLLVTLLERPGQVLTRAELTQRLWGTDTHVDAVAGLNTAVAKLREVLEDDAESPRYIETVPKRGYRFIGKLAGEGTERRSNPPDSRRIVLWGAVAVVAIAALCFAWLRPDGAPRTRVAVVLFDNETGRPELDRMAQALTDATVFELTAASQLEVIGNAAALRTARPLRDLERIRDAIHADFIVIGQVQTQDRAIHVRTHLIRARDLAHVWVDNFPSTAAGEAALQSAVAGRVTAAVTKLVQAPG